MIELPAAVGQNTALGLSTTNCQAKDVASKTQIPQSVIEVCAAKVGGGAAVTLNDSIVQKIGGDATTDGCQGGVDVQAGYAPTGQMGHVGLTSDTIESYQKNGVTVDGPGSTGKINGVSVTGAGPTTALAQNGVQISLGATGTVTDSTIIGNNYTGTPTHPRRACSSSVAAVRSAASARSRRW